MTTQKLMERLDALDHSERLRELILHARQQEPPAVDSLISDLAQGPMTWRWLAVMVATHTKHIDYLWRAVRDESVLVRCAGAKLLGKVASVIPVSLMDELDSNTLRVLFGELIRRDASVIEPLVVGLIERSRMDEAGSLFCACSAAFVEEHIDIAWPEDTWTRLAKHHAKPLVAKIENEFVTATRADVVWLHYRSDVWTSLCKTCPDEMVSWIDRFAEPSNLPPTILAGLPRLVLTHPERVVEWLTTRRANTYRLPAGLSRHARRLTDAQLQPLADALVEQPDALAQLLSRLPYPRRRRLFEHAVKHHVTDLIEWPESLMRVLPIELSDREAARMLALPRAKTDGSWRRKLLGMRECATIRSVLELETRSAIAEERGEAYAAMIRSNAKSRVGLAESLTWLQRTRNEQDPVRAAYLQAMAELPGHHFDEPELLDAVIAPAFEARDTSYQTRWAITKVAQRLMVTNAADPESKMFKLALSLLERLAGHSGTPDLPLLHPGLPKGAETAIFNALKPWLIAAKSRQQYGHIFRLWWALGERAWRIGELSDLIEDILWKGQKSSAHHAATLWLEDPATRDARVREMVARDASATYVYQVFQHCCVRRQTLLGKRFTKSPPKGRFHDGKVTHLIRVERGFHRWTIAQQELYIAMYRKAEAEARQYATTRVLYVSGRARIPATRISDLHHALNSTDVVIQEAALGAIVWTDSPADALEILLEHLDSDRARVAMYALPRLAKLVPRTTLLEALQRVLSAEHVKVTVQKEALRLLGWVGTSRAVAVLKSQWEKPLHRDVRIAALHSARSLLGHELAWQVLSEAATGDDGFVAQGLVNVPVFNVAANHRPRYLQLMLKTADHESPEARIALFEALRSGWALSDVGASVEVAQRVLCRMDGTDPWRRAAVIVADAGREESMHAAILECVGELVGLAKDVAPKGQDDQMAHQRLLGLLGVMNHRHKSCLKLAARVAEKLLVDPLWWSEAAPLSCASASNAGLATTISELASKLPSALSVTTLVRAAQAQAGLSERLWDVVDAQEAVESLSLGPAPARLCAVAMLGVFGAQWGWGESWVKVLQRLRNDDDLDVKRAARSVWIATI